MKHIIIIGSGVAGLRCAIELSHLGIRTTILEKQSTIGGKVRGWYKLFPSFTSADDVVGELLRHVTSSEHITIRTECEAVGITPHVVTLRGGEQLECDAVVVASGFELFDARQKEEYGYGIYDNVITSADLEDMFNRRAVKLTNGGSPRRIALLHCVGSRDAKVCQHHCSKVCCVTGVKQAMELKKMFPTADIFNFYMDIRMFGPGYEEMYREAQAEYNIHFVRGRISEVSPTIDNRLQIKAEDTLTGRPLKMGVDMLVLLIGMKAGASNALYESECNLRRHESGFMQPRDHFLGNTESNVKGIFYAGTVTAPKTIGESLNEAVVVAHSAAEWIKHTA